MEVGDGVSKSIPQSVGWQEALLRSGGNENRRGLESIPSALISSMAFCLDEGCTYPFIDGVDGFHVHVSYSFQIVDSTYMEKK